MVLFLNFFYNEKFLFYFFRKNFLFFFLFKYIRVVLRFFSICFLKTNERNMLSFIFTSRSIFSGFLKKLLNCFNSLSYIFFFKLRLKGLGYRVRRVAKNLYKFFFIYTNFYYLHLPLSVFLKIKRRRLIFYGFDLNILKLVLTNLLLLNKLFIYTVRGLLFPNQIILLKPGKKRI
jgi:hypothetical protein